VGLSRVHANDGVTEKTKYKINTRENRVKRHVKKVGGGQTGPSVADGWILSLLCKGGGAKGGERTPKKQKPWPVGGCNYPPKGAARKVLGKGGSARKSLTSGCWGVGKQKTDEQVVTRKNSLNKMKRKRLKK